MIGTALAVAAGTLAVGLLLALLARRLPTLRLRLAALALGAVLLPLGAVVISGALMLERDDLRVVAVAAAAGVAAVAGALWVAHSVMQPVGRMRRTAEELARGDLSARAAEDGPGELRELGAAVNRMAAELERLFDARRQLVANASHDLRTPLASLQVMLEAIEDGLAPAERYLPDMRDQVRHLARLVDDLLELARIDSGALGLELREVTLGPLVEGCVRSVEARALAGGVRVESRIAGELPPVRCAPDQIERVLLNLLSNALRHTPGDGAVAVLVEPAEGGVRVSVEDSGEGIAPDALEDAFERFWRADASRARDRGGAGLGLAIARGLVEAHGGRIWAEARPEGGARVSFQLPRQAPQPA